MKTSLHLFLVVARVAGVVAVATSINGCVAAKHYDEARSVAETEMAGHARTRARLENALARLDELEKQLRDKDLLLAEKQQELDAGQSAMAASKLETTVALTEKRAAGELVDQLRAELARTGDHLRAYAGEKRDIEQALQEAEERLRKMDAATTGMSELVAVARDLAVGLGDELSAGEAALGVENGALVLRVPMDQLFVPEQSALGPSTHDVLSAIASVTVTHPSYKVELRATPDTLGEARARTLQSALVDKGVPSERLTVNVASGQAAPAPVAGSVVPATGAPAPAKDEGRGDVAAEGSMPAVAPAMFEIVLSRI